MKFLLLIFTFLLSSTTYAQTITYFDGKGDTVTVNDKWSYYIQLRQEKDQDSIWIEEKFSNNNQILRQKYFYYKSPDKQVRHGKYQIWDSSGVTLQKINFYHGKFDGSLKTYWNNGQLKRDELYRLDSLLSGNCYDSSGKIIEHFPFIIYSDYKGGREAMMAFIQKNLHYPEDALDNDMEGTVKIKFTVNKDGMLSGITIVDAPCISLGEEAIRVIQLMDGNWSPEYIDGVPVSVNMMVPFRFKLTGNVKKSPKRR